MTGPDKRDFLSALTDLFAAWGKDLDETQANAYWKFLEDLPLEDVRQGIARAGRTGGRYVPSVGQIRDSIEVVTGAGRVRDTRHDFSQGVDCEVCEDTGWAPTQVPHPRGYLVSAVRPCTCARGAGKAGGRQLDGAA